MQLKVEIMDEMLHASVKLAKGFLQTVDDGRSHGICIDLPPEDGTDLGPTALELCVMSYAGCVATISALIAKNSRVSIKDLEVKVEAVKSDEEGTITETNSDIKVKTDAPEDKIRRIVELAIRTCPVAKLFGKASVKEKHNIMIEKG
jgi:putative redox protein